MAHPNDANLPDRQGMFDFFGGKGAFVLVAIVFFVVAIFLFSLAGFSLYSSTRDDEVFRAITLSLLGADGVLIDKILQFAVALFGQLTRPLILIFSAIFCAFMGYRILRAAGIVRTEVIPLNDYELLSTAIRENNEKAISEYIRLSSLTGFTGSFTHIGLTGLPFATIIIFIFLCLLSVFDDKFFDLAKLTLGAFIGSYVQRQSDQVKSELKAAKASEAGGTDGGGQRRQPVQPRRQARVAGPGG